MLFGGLEAGGTKMVCAVTDEYGKVLDRMSIPTTTAEENIPVMLEYFKKFKLDGLGIGTFGPLNLNPASPNFGAITKSPKGSWQGVNLRKAFLEALQIPVGIDTDVNAAILGEVCFGAAKGLESAIYITVGTGIGIGVYINGGLLHGLAHPEAGHIKLVRHPKDKYEGCCLIHKDCFEGLASGPALMYHWGKPAKDLYDQPEVWEIESYYIAQAIVTYILTYAPQKIVLWGGVIHNPVLLPMIKKQVVETIDGFIELPEDLLVEPGLGDNPGIIGSAQLGYRAWQQANNIKA